MQPEVRIFELLEWQLDTMNPCLPAILQSVYQKLRGYESVDLAI